MKKIIICLVIFVVLNSIALADLIMPLEDKQLENENIKATLCTTRLISYNGIIKSFYNANSEEVYPISYQGSTYLPIRSISSLFGIGIKWDEVTRSIYLGDGEVDTNSCKDADDIIIAESSSIEAILNRQLDIYYNNEIQFFFDANDEQVFPISFRGTTYLPVRSISNMLNVNIRYNSDKDAVEITKSETKNTPYGAAETARNAINELDKLLVQAYNEQYSAYEGTNCTVAVAKTIVAIINSHNNNIEEVSKYGRIEINGISTQTEINNSKTYTIKISGYNEKGFVSEVTITENK